MKKQLTPSDFRIIHEKHRNIIDGAVSNYFYVERLRRLWKFKWWKREKSWHGDGDGGFEDVVYHTIEEAKKYIDDQLILFNHKKTIHTV